MAHHFETGIVEQMRYVGAPTGEEVVHAEHFSPGIQQALAQEGADKAGTAGDENSGDIMHPPAIPAFPYGVKTLRHFRAL